MQAAGNDFILVDAGKVNRDWSRMAVTMCDRHFGVGGDGLLVVSPSDKANLRMREFNLDGSEAEACGNGLRCVAKYAAYSGLVSAGTRQILVETIAGIRQAKLDKTRGKVTRIQVSMGEPRFGVKDIPVMIEPSQGETVDIKPILDYPLTIDGTELLLNFVSMGNPHAVCFWQHPVADFPLSQLGPQIERHRLFPNRINFEIAKVISRQRIEARVWERGVGETLACGSGACAITVASKLLGYTEHKADVKLPGGILDAEWNGAGEVILGGPAETVFNGKWPD